MSNEDEYLTQRECDEYMNDFSQVMHIVIEQVIALADRHNVDRDNAMQHFAAVFSAMTQCSTFEHFENSQPPSDYKLNGNPIIQYSILDDKTDNETDMDE